MKIKKVLMIALLIIFLVAIGRAVVKINNKAVESTESKSTATEESDNSDILEITDNYFIEQTNDIFYNMDDYIDKTIKIEGLIYSYEDDDSGNTYYAVVRNTPGCCGADSLAGLDIRYDGEYPEENAWVEVVGVLKTDTVYGSEIPALQVISMKETEEGVTFVTN